MCRQVKNRKVITVYQNIAQDIQVNINVEVYVPFFVHDITVKQIAFKDENENAYYLLQTDLTRDRNISLVQDNDGSVFSPINVIHQINREIYGIYSFSLNDGTEIHKMVNAGYLHFVIEFVEYEDKDKK